MDADLGPRNNPMKIRSVIYGLAVSWLLLGGARALDLTPQSGFFQGGEGPPMPVIRFNDGARKIRFQPPFQWQASGTGNSVTFFSPDARQAYMKMVAVDLAKPPPADEDLEASARRYLPAEVEKAELIKTVPSPFTLEGHPSTEFYYNLTVASTHVTESVSILDFSPKLRLVLIISAEPKSFDKVHQLAISSMFSWNIED